MIVERKVWDFAFLGAKLLGFIIVILFFYVMLFLFVPGKIYSKIGVSLLSLIIFIDIFKNYLYVQWILIRTNH
jgi:hypothetical protein